MYKVFTKSFFQACPKITIRLCKNADGIQSDCVGRIDELLFLFAICHRQNVFFHHNTPSKNRLNRGICGWIYPTLSEAEIQALRTHNYPIWIRPLLKRYLFYGEVSVKSKEIFWCHFVISVRALTEFKKKLPGLERFFRYGGIVRFFANLFFKPSPNLQTLRALFHCLLHVFVLYVFFFQFAQFLEVNFHSCLCCLLDSYHTAPF